MKKLIITCALLSASTLLSYAQSANSSPTNGSQPAKAPVNHTAAPAPMSHAQPEQIAQRRAMVFQKQLGLNDQQYQGVYKVELDYAKQVESMRSNGVKPTDGAMTQANTSREQRLQNVMTPDQWSKYQSMKPKPATMPNAQPNGNSQPASKN